MTRPSERNGDRVVVLANASPDLIALATHLGLPLAPAATDAPFILTRENDQLQVRWNRPAAPRPLTVDLAELLMARRGSGRHPLLRAAGAATTLFDLTAGLGRDAMLLAARGFQVTAVERNAVLFALLDDAMTRARRTANWVSVAERIRLVHADALTWCAGLESSLRPDVVYLDPMFVGDHKSAQVKREAQFLRELLHHDSPSNHDTELFAMARRLARKRVVVKRRLRDAPLAKQPTQQWAGRAVRFDLYVQPGER